ncbi:VanZ family protein [Paenibacillus sp. MAH-36]|uniref:VanZ family protein n=1 Tax=Paenibacillus violae TaxID=3077234 RepID=A0ABU3RQB6_9BACL|nr:VanZ family protein [Paenibacillus sp. PFR10]MDU0206281.1 VanZ family protein [Paenibacillus sp. PFR10]
MSKLNGSLEGEEASTIMSKINSKHIFILYLFGLVNFVIVKFFVDIKRVIDRVASNKAQKAMVYWNLELIPFRTIFSSIDSYIRVGMVPSSINLIANIALFVPMGYLIPIVDSICNLFGISGY